MPEKRFPFLRFPTDWTQWPLEQLSEATCCHYYRVSRAISELRRAESHGMVGHNYSYGQNSEHQNRKCAMMLSM
jgi:hypothetical protein